jgi:UDP-N-acetylglucosamine--N-acetylmuramyl-(pentapeptide) pyrophosphoryl-undecaprenol N-acetylglucosamine transferase
MNILIACGGTGGHLFPGIAVAEALRGRGHHACLLISGKEVDAVASAKYAHLPFEVLPAVAKPPTLSPRMIPFLWRLLNSWRRSRALVRKIAADVVLGMGGFTSLPPVWAGHGLGCGTFVHDSNARPGRANVLTSRFCTRVLLGMADAVRWFPNRDCIVTGTPVRPEIVDRPPRDEAMARFGLDPAKRTVLVTGGSQGAQRLNDICTAAAGMLPDDIQMLHIAGAADLARTKSAAAANHRSQRVLGFCDRMADAYAVADLVVSRSGASSLTEIAACGLPSVLVPYPFAADDHQTLNAEAFARAGAARLVAQRDLDAEKLSAIITDILHNEAVHARMAAAARSLAATDAAQRVCDAIEATMKRAA